MKLHATCTPFESIPASQWLALKNAIVSLSAVYGVRVAIEDDLTVRDAEVRFTEWLRRPVEGE